jgi:aspartokinase/homoserine dehydrogenase 1
VKGITSIEHMALVNLEGAGMIGVPGTAHRLFGALREEGISVILISQGSSEHSICCAIPQEQAARAATVVRAAFERELQEGQIQSIDMDLDLAILAVVGDGMAGRPGIAAKVFNSLGTASVNVRAIAQGASERNISVVIEGRQATRALRAVHAGLYLSPHTLSIGSSARAPWAACCSISSPPKARGCARSSTSTCASAAFSPRAAWCSRRRARSCGLARRARRAVRSPRTSAASSSTCTRTTCRTRCSLTARRARSVARHYPDWFKRGIHVVTPNKKANSADWEFYQSCARRGD